ncbi:MAG: SRPBCC family protein [Gammaproteobacteria bacterium]|jgi:hypothetical protein|nr:SRPBCC family protein [Gammaproteobacteria bacterium]
MKLLKNLGYLLSVLFLGLALLGLFLPSTVRVERRLTVDANPADLVALLASPTEFVRWSPWGLSAAGTDTETDGPQAGPGARLRWSGAPLPTRHGWQEVLEVTPDRRVRTQMRLGLYGTVTSTFDLYPSSGEPGTQVAWTFEADYGFNLIRRYVALGFESIIGPDLEHGLANLRVLAKRG